jgi:hypothetical protein
MTTALLAALLLVQAAPSPPAPPASTPAAPTVPPAPDEPPEADEEEAELPVLSGFETPTGKKFTGEFKDTPVGDALREVVKSAGLSIVLPSGLFGTVNADFNAAPVEDVLRIVLAQNELRGVREGTILTVSRATSGSVVIRGGKRRIEFGTGRERFRIHIDPDRIRGDAERAARDAERDARDIEREVRRAEKDLEADLDDEADGDGVHDRVLSGDQVVKPGERVGELVVLRGNVRLEPGSRAQQVTAVMGSVDVGPGVQIEREVVAVGGDVHVSSGAHIGADVVSVGGKLVLDEGARIDGQQTAVDVPGLGGLFSIAGSRPWSAPEAPLPIRIGHAIAQFAMFFALGLLLLVITPRRVESVGRSLTNAPGKALLTGFLGTLALPVLTLLLVVTIVGIPLVAVLILAVVAGVILGFTAVAQMIGERLPLGTRGGQVLRLAVGTALLVIATKIPILGALVWIAGWFFIFGAVLRTRFGQPPAAVQTMPMPPPFPPAPQPPPASPPPVAP